MEQTGCLRTDLPPLRAKKVVRNKSLAVRFITFSVPKQCLVLCKDLGIECFIRCCHLFDKIFKKCWPHKYFYIEYVIWTCNAFSIVFSLSLFRPLFILLLGRELNLTISGKLNGKYSGSLGFEPRVSPSLTMTTSSSFKSEPSGLAHHIKRTYPLKTKQCRKLS